MKNVELNKITIQNFKGIASYEQEFNGNTDITADVKQGKSTIKEAYLFALGVDIDNYYPTDKDNNYIDGLDVKVELELFINDLEYKISRGAKINYKNDKEKGIKVFDGFSKDIFEIDGMPCGTKDFKTKISDILGIDNFDTFKTLSILNYFNEKLEWKERRKLLYDLYVNKEDIAKLKDCTKYDLLANELKKGNGSAEITSLLNSENNKLVDLRRRNEIILAEKQTELSNYVEVDYSRIEKDLAKVEKQIKAEEELLKSKNANEIREQQLTKLSALNLELIKLERQDNETKSQIERNILTAEGNIALIQNRGITIESNIKVKTDEYKSIKAKEYDPTKEICPTCKQALPQDQIETIRETFDGYKATRMQQITESVKSLKADYEAQKSRLIEEQEKLETYEKQKEMFGANEMIESTKSQIEEITALLNDFKSEELDTTKIDSLKHKQAELFVELGNKNAHQKCKERVAELIEEQKEIVNNEIKLAKKRQQLEQYILDVIDLINDSINDNFNGVKFKLFKVQTASAKKDIQSICETTNEGVIYDAMSTGQKAEVNLEILNTLHKKFEVNLPLFVDDASITNIKTLPQNQIIFFYNQKGAKLNCTKISEVY